MTSASNSSSYNQNQSFFPGGFSVLMAVYFKDNTRLLDLAIESVMSNTLKPDQFVIVADGKLSMELEALLHRSALKYSNCIELVWLPNNAGLANALNIGLSHIKFPWVARADADDINLPNRFELMANLLEKYPGVELMSSSILEVDEFQNPISVRRVPESQPDIIRFLRYRNPFNHMAVVYSLRSVMACGAYPNVHLKEDYALWSTMISRGIRVANRKEILVHATAGADMYKRRGGLRYAKAEIDIQRILVRDGFKGLFGATSTGFLRSCVFLAPNFLRGLIYKHLLRGNELS